MYLSLVGGLCVFHWVVKIIEVHKILIIADIVSFIQVFETPKDHRKAKPFHDHVFVFSIVDDHIWFRNYQVCVFIHT